jgi:hypothetical protein
VRRDKKYFTCKISQGKFIPWLFLRCYASVPFQTEQPKNSFLSYSKKFETHRGEKRKIFCFLIFCISFRLIFSFFSHLTSHTTNLTCFMRSFENYKKKEKWKYEKYLKRCQNILIIIKIIALSVSQMFYLWWVNVKEKWSLSHQFMKEKKYKKIESNWRPDPSRQLRNFISKNHEWKSSHFCVSSQLFFWFQWSWSSLTKENLYFFLVRDIKSVLIILFWVEKLTHKLFCWD